MLRLTHSTVLTNFLSIDQRPTTIFVYIVEFVTHWIKSGDPVFVSRNFDQQGLFTALLAHAWHSPLNAHTDWVTDYANVWLPFFAAFRDQITHTCEPQIDTNEKVPHPSCSVLHFHFSCDITRSSTSILA